MSSRRRSLILFTAGVLPFFALWRTVGASWALAAGIVCWLIALVALSFGRRA